MPSRITGYFMPRRAFFSPSITISSPQTPVSGSIRRSWDARRASTSVIRSARSTISAISAVKP